eukprot:jgi/Mesvir1/23753/Mv18685-RA.1
MVANLPETLSPAEGAGRKRAQRAKGQISRGSGKTYLARLTKILRHLGYEPDKDGAKPVTPLLDTKKVREAVDALSEPSERGGKKDRAITKKTNAKDLFSSINSIDNQMDAGKRIPQDVREAYVEDMATSQEDGFKYLISGSPREKGDGMKVSFHIVVKYLKTTDLAARHYIINEFGYYVRSHFLDPDSTFHKDAALLINREKGWPYIQKKWETFADIPKDCATDGNIKLVIDESIYTKNRCFRMVGHHKFGQHDPNAVLRIISGSDDIKDHLVNIYPTTDQTGVQTVEMPEGWKEHYMKKSGNAGRRAPSASISMWKTVSGTFVDASKVARSVEAIAKVSPGSRYMNTQEQFSVMRGGAVKVSRFTLDPGTKCLICKESHNSPGHGPRVEEYSDGEVAYTCWAEKPKPCKTHIKIADRFEYISDKVEFTEVYSEGKVRHFDLAPIVHSLHPGSTEKLTYITQSSMGTGKSEANRAMIAAVLNLYKDARVLLMFANISLSRQEEYNLNKDVIDPALNGGKTRTRAELLADYRYFLNYLKNSRKEEGANDYWITHPRVLVVLNSILRLQDRRFDVVILDEVDSIFNALSNAVMRDRENVFKALMDIITNAKVLIASDANITAGAVNFIRSHRPATDFRVINNEYVRPTNRVLHFTRIKPGRGCEKEWIYQASKQAKKFLDAGKTFVLVSSEAGGTLDRVREQLGDSLNGVNTRRYTSKTPKGDLDLGANEAWKDVQYLEYSPTISVGVSYTLPTFDSMIVMARNSDKHAPYTTTLQQMHRVRQLREGDVHVFYLDSTTPATRPLADFKLIKSHTRQQVDEMFMMMKGLKSSVISSWGEDGERLFGDTSPAYNLLCRNLEALGASRSHYDELMIRTLRERYGYKIAGEVQAGRSEEAPKLKKIEKGEFEPRMISAEEYRELTARAGDRDAILTDAECKLVEMYELCHDRYKISEDLIDEGLIKELADEKARETYHAREQYSRVTELGWEAAIGEGIVDDRARKSENVFGLVKNKKIDHAYRLTMARKLLAGSGIMEFCLDGKSASSTAISRERLTEAVNKLDRDWMYTYQGKFRSVFGYQRRSKNGPGCLSFEQCVGVLESILASTLGINTRTWREEHEKASDAYVSKECMIEFFEKYKPEWWGKQAEIAEDIRKVREFKMPSDYQFAFR